jgi:hypothetical protein
VFESLAVGFTTGRKKKKQRRERERLFFFFFFAVIEIEKRIKRVFQQKRNIEKREREGARLANRFSVFVFENCFRDKNKKPFLLFFFVKKVFGNCFRKQFYKTENNS